MPDRSPASLVAGGLGGWSQQSGYQEGTRGSMECALELVFCVCVCETTRVRFNFMGKSTFFPPPFEIFLGLFNQPRRQYS